MSQEDKFHAHLDECIQCREQIFNLCNVGIDLLQQTVKESGETMFESLVQWNHVLSNSRSQP